MKSKMIGKFVLAFLIGGCISYLLRKYMNLSTNIFMVIIPVVFGLGSVWLYGRMKKNEK